MLTNATRVAFRELFTTKNNQISQSREYGKLDESNAKLCAADQSQRICKTLSFIKTIDGQHRTRHTTIKYLYMNYRQIICQLPSCNLQNQFGNNLIK